MITDADIAINEMLNKEGFKVCDTCPFYEEAKLVRGYISDICELGYVAPSDCLRVRKIILGAEEE